MNPYERVAVKLAGRERNRLRSEAQEVMLKRIASGQQFRPEIEAILAQRLPQQYQDARDRRGM